MRFSYNWLQDYIQGKLPPANKLAELLMFHSFEIESVEVIGKDSVLDIKVLSNRGCDCFSHIGIARECATLAGLRFEVRGLVKLKEDKSLKAKDILAVRVEGREDCPRYTACVIQGIKVGPSPKWMQERLVACGLQAINNIVDITNYVMLETGQPLHAFDLEKIKNAQAKGEILVRRAKKGEKIKTLDKDRQEYILDESILVIANAKESIAIAGIKGGEATGILQDTKDIIVEAANFNGSLIRKASQKLKIKTDASWRFENGLSLSVIDFAQSRASALIQEYAGGKVLQGMIDVGSKNPLPKKIILDLDYIEKLLGVKIPQRDAERILKSLGFGAEVFTSGLGGKAKFVNPVLKVEVPLARLDIDSQEDLIEEISRIYGYDKIVKRMPKADLTSPQRNSELFWENRVKSVLKELGFSEVYNYSFIGEQEKQVFSYDENNLVVLANPMSSFNKYLRPGLMPGILKNAKDNLRWFSEIKIFEIGKVFQNNQAVLKNGKSISQVKYHQHISEEKMLSGILVKKGGKEQGFYELKGAVEELLNQLGVLDVWYDEISGAGESPINKLCHLGKTAEIKIGDEKIGLLASIHPDICECMGIEEDIFFFELEFGKLLKIAIEEKEYQVISSFPSSLRDIAVLAPQGTKMAEVQNIIENAGGSLVVDVDIFDIYSGESVEEGKENLAFHIVYRANDRTLSSKEVDEAQNNIIKALGEKGWEIRK